MTKKRMSHDVLIRGKPVKLVTLKSLLLSTPLDPKLSDRYPCQNRIGAGKGTIPRKLLTET
jgi:hypothetical protein